MGIPCKKDVLIIAGAAGVAAVCSPVIVPQALGAIGFGPLGPVAGTHAAAMMASAGTVAKGSLIAVCQHVAMTGAIGNGVVAVTAGAGAAAGAVGCVAVRAGRGGARLVGWLVGRRCKKQQDCSIIDGGDGEPSENDVDAEEDEGENLVDNAGDLMLL